MLSRHEGSNCSISRRLSLVGAICRIQSRSMAPLSSAGLQNAATSRLNLIIRALSVKFSTAAVNDTMRPPANGTIRSLYCDCFSHSRNGPACLINGIVVADVATMHDFGNAAATIFQRYFAADDEISVPRDHPERLNADQHQPSPALRKLNASGPHSRDRGPATENPESAGGCTDQRFDSKHPRKNLRQENTYQSK